MFNDLRKNYLCFSSINSLVFPFKKDEHIDYPNVLLMRCNKVTDSMYNICYTLYNNFEHFWKTMNYGDMAHCS